MKKYLWIFLIVLTAGLLRFWHLTQVPPALNSDEVAIGYNAYSILKTGRDEYGLKYPLTFRSFDDYKMPVYVYLVVGSMRLFGYGDFAVRFPSALFGVIAVLFTYLLTRELFVVWGRRESERIALVSAAGLAISPWALMFSRSGYEANVAIAFIIVGVYLFMKGLKYAWLFPLSSIFFALAVWTYLTPRIFVPLLGLGLVWIYWKSLWRNVLPVIIAGIIATILLFPIVRMSLSVQGQMRAAGVSAFTNPDDLKKSVLRTTIDEKNGNKLFTVFDNRRLTYAITFLRGYFAHFDPNFLFLDKSIDKYRAPDTGLLYLFEAPLILVGAYMLIRKRSKATAVVAVWLLASPVAAAFTLQLPHPVRTLVFLPAWQVLSAIGLTTLLPYAVRLKGYAKPIVIGVGSLLIGLNIMYYFHQYYAFLPIEDANYWYVGRKEMVGKIQKLAPSYDRVIVSNSLDFPYIFYLYYAHIDPSVYLAQGGTVSGGFEEQRNHVGDIEFRSIAVSQRDPLKRTLFVGLPAEVFKKSLVVDTIYYPDGTPAIALFQ